MALAALVVAGISWLATTSLFQAAQSTKDVALATLRVDVIRTGLTVGIGAGGAVALLLNARRQWLQERAQAHAELDSAERQVTDLYSKAVEQLGSDKAAVRLAGLCSLERLAQSNTGHRQTVVDVVCAYLRMPYLAEDVIQRLYMEARGQTQDSRARALQAEADQELQVRLTAQRILTSHLRPGAGNPIYWSGIELDLASATLIHFDLDDCHVASGRFAGARFVGTTVFRRATLGNAGFPMATFERDTWFDEATFNAGVTFARAKFDSYVSFDRANLVGGNYGAGFKLRKYDAGAGISVVSASFSKAHFNDEASFSGARFDGGCFEEAIFTTHADFADAIFSRGALFVDTEFHGDVTFIGCEFVDEPLLHGATIGDSGEVAGLPTTWRIVRGLERRTFRHIGGPVDGRHADLEV